MRSLTEREGEREVEVEEGLEVVDERREWVGVRRRW